MNDWIKGFLLTGFLFAFIIFLSSGDISIPIFVIGGIIGAIAFPKFKEKENKH
jgi:Tfp pilus assembly major pilin PilA